MIGVEKLAGAAEGRTYEVTAGIVLSAYVLNSAGAGPAAAAWGFWIRQAAIPRSNSPEQRPTQHHSLRMHDRYQGIFRNGFSYGAGPKSFNQERAGSAQLSWCLIEPIRTSVQKEPGLRVQLYSFRPCCA